MTSYRVFVDNEGAPAVTLARVLAGVRGADHAVGDLAALVACGLTRSPAAAKPVMCTLYTTRVLCRLTC